VPISLTITIQAVRGLRKLRLFHNFLETLWLPLNIKGLELLRGDFRAKTMRQRLISPFEFDSFLQFWSSLFQKIPILAHQESTLSTNLRG